MGQEIVVFHSALGLRPAVDDFADRLRNAGHRVHTPDLFEGAVFDDLALGIRRRDEIGIDQLIGRAQEAVSGLPDEIVFAGFSMGVGAAEYLAATRAGALAAILMHGAFDPAAFGITDWPHVAVQVHYAAGDPEVDVDAVGALERAVVAVGAPLEVHAYDAGGHLFEDRAYEGFHAASAAAMTERVLEFLARLETTPRSPALAIERADATPEVASIGPAVHASTKHQLRG